jgi:citrate lyase subunit beta / citryl-CoA lyase
MRARSYLYAPGHRPELIAKALASEADVVVADLEDAVPADLKARARANVAAALAERPSKPLHVRVNALRGDLGPADLRTVAAAGAPVVRVPKVESPADVHAAADALAEAGGQTRIACLLESAAGVEGAYAVATAHPRVAAISLGEADLRADLGATGDEGLLYARSRCVTAARAAGLARPVQSVYVAVGDDEGLRRSCAHGKALGFFGRSAIHPAQLPVINAAYTPTPEEVAAARELTEAMERAGDDGGAVLADGRFVDRAVVEAARATLETAR